MMTMRQLPPEAVRDTLAAVFRQPAYARGTRETLWNRLLTWASGVLDRLGDYVAGSPVAQWTARVALVAAALLVAARLAYVGWAWWQARERGVAGPARVRAAGADDPWARAEAAAADGRHTDAAHLLYQALLARLAARERLRLHPSKTVGDYGRELRARSSGAYPGYREFARLYEVVVYGLQHCDRERYARLHALALAIDARRGAAAA
jgi:hypothetical protein